METIFINTHNSKTSEPNRFRYSLIDKLNLKNLNKIIAPVNMSVYYTWKNVKSKYNNNKFKLSGPTWSETFELSDGSYNIQQIQDYFEVIMKKHETITDDNFPIKIYSNNIKNRIVFKTKTGYKLELLTNEIMNLLGNGSIIDKYKNKNTTNLPQLEIVTTVSVHCNIVQNNY